MAKLSEVASAIEAVNATLEKARVEIVTQIEALKASDPDLSPEGNEALARLQALAKSLDDVVPDAPVVAAPEAAV